MVEPGTARHSLRLAAACERAAHLEVGKTVVVARILRRRTLAAQSVLALQEVWLLRQQSEIELEFRSWQTGHVSFPPLFQRPIADPDPRTSRLRTGSREIRMRCTLLVQELAVRRIRERGMSNDQLGRRGPIGGVSF